MYSMGCLDVYFSQKFQEHAFPNILCPIFNFPSSKNFNFYNFPTVRVLSFKINVQLNLTSKLEVSLVTFNLRCFQAPYVARYDGTELSWPEAGIIAQDTRIVLKALVPCKS